MGDFSGDMGFKGGGQGLVGPGTTSDYVLINTDIEIHLKDSPHDGN